MADEAVVRLACRPRSAADVVRVVIVEHQHRVAQRVVVVAVDQGGHRHPRHAELHGEREHVDDAVTAKRAEHGCFSG